MKNPFLTGEKIYLSPITKEDISDEYIGWLNDKEVCRDNSHATFPNNRTRAMEYVENAQQSKTDLVFTIRWKENDRHIGNAALIRIDPVYRCADIVILIGNKDFWGRGVGTECYRLLIDHGFRQLNLNRMASGLTSRNKAMIKICEKVGMRKEGTLREAMFKDGQYLDVELYAILRGEFKG